MRGLESFVMMQKGLIKISGCPFRGFKCLVLCMHMRLMPCHTCIPALRLLSVKTPTSEGLYRFRTQVPKVQSRWETTRKNAKPCDRAVEAEAVTGMRRQVRYFF